MFKFLTKRTPRNDNAEITRLRAANAKLVDALKLADAYIPASHTEAWTLVRDAIDAAKGV